MTFQLHKRLQEDTFGLVGLSLSRVLLMNDASFPWMILVPERAGIREVHELSGEERSVLIEEISVTSEILQRLFAPDKINIGTLGNLVPQLHVHIVARFKTDRSWPGPVWGSGPGRPYSADELSDISSRIRQAFRQKGWSTCPK